jgi:hypothetical protein
LGIILILITGLIHVIDAPDSFSEAAYKGWLFYANGVGAFGSAVGIFSRKGWGWKLGLVIAAASFLSYVASRTVGLPMIPAEPDAWLGPLGIASLLAEALFVGVFFGMMKMKGK